MTNQSKIQHPNNLKKRIRYYKNLISQYQNEIENGAKINQRSKILKNKISEIENKFTLFNIKGQLKYNKEYTILKDELSKLNKKQTEIPTLKSKLIEYQKQKNKLELEFKEANIDIRKKKIENKNKKKIKNKDKEDLEHKSKKNIQLKLKVEKFKNSIGGSSQSLTSSKSIWSVKKR